MSKEIIELMDEKFLQMKKEIEDSYYEFRASLMSDYLKLEKEKKENQKNEKKIIFKKVNEKSEEEKSIEEDYKLLENLNNSGVFVSKENYAKVLNVLKLTKAFNVFTNSERAKEKSASVLTNSLLDLDNKHEVLEYLRDNVYLSVSRIVGEEPKDNHFGIVSFREEVVAAIIQSGLTDIFLYGEESHKLMSSYLGNKIFEEISKEFGLDSHRYSIREDGYVAYNPSTQLSLKEIKEQFVDITDEFPINIKEIYTSVK